MASKASVLRILVACSISKTVLECCLSLGHDAVACDVQSPVHSLPFIKGDVREILHLGWDAMIGFPPCQYLTKVQQHLVWNDPERAEKQAEAVQFFKDLYYSPIPQVILENPPGFLSYSFRQPNQIVMPCYFGDPYHKKIGLWLKNSPPVISSLFNPVRKSIDNHTNGRMTNSERSNVRSSWAYFPGMAYQICLQSFGKVV
jgi:hypothetical protein